MTNSSALLSIGLMSGTSMDGIDASLLRTDGNGCIEPIENITLPYDEATRRRIRNAIDGKGNITELECDLTLMHAQAITRLLKQSGHTAKDIHVIGFHGHTIDHRPHEGITRQIGDGPLLAQKTGINVVYDFRSNDVKHGGQGAPLAPVYHQAITAECNKPVAVVNIGGVANVSWIGNNDDILAFDTGPGNALIDDWLLKHLEQRYDKDGEIAARGYLMESVLQDFMEHPYFEQLPPKSLDRDDFNTLVNHLEGLSVDNVTTTLTAFTAHSIARAQRFFEAPVKEWYITGGGRHNHTLMEMLAEVLDAPVEPIETLGINGDSLEADAFAYMAIRHCLKLPISFAGTTGITQPALVGGVFCQA